MIDFTLTTYRQLLLALQAANYNFYTFEDWCQGRAIGKYVILRHDVDLKAERSHAIAKVEAELGIRSTYYFRVVPQSNQPDIIRAIAALGHEIGYHYEDLSLFDGDVDNSLVHFKKQLAYFSLFYPVKTVCMHGSPASKYDNRNLWKNNNYRDLGIIGEPYFDFLTPENLGKGVLYFTDTARMWDGDKYNVRDRGVGSRELGVGSKKLDVGSREFIGTKEGDVPRVGMPEYSIASPTGGDKQMPDIHSTFDFINWLEADKPSNPMMITTHPQRWTDNKLDWWKELIMQSVKNQVKRVLIGLK